ncbi:hypothetical protein DSO57_1033252 [Entomophthora muscae]|uniref:Uncharacterized protein n=1 Tax=Entomophthora muscae TaxID=34485 RepID=A0ACC2T017_9FUNG|nr:hypothetical protein DSO57_1033252 [Entomophthora muscae]
MKKRNKKEAKVVEQEMREAEAEYSVEERSKIWSSDQHEPLDLLEIVCLWYAQQLSLSASCPSHITSLTDSGKALVMAKTFVIVKPNRSPLNIIDIPVFASSFFGGDGRMKLLLALDPDMANPFATSLFELPGLLPSPLRPINSPCA